MIKRAKLTSHFTVVNNRVLENKQLSLKAKGLWAFVMTKPDGWQTSIRGLETQLQEGEASLRAALKELETVGLYRKQRLQMSDGKFTWTDEMFDEPQLDNPVMDNPRLENYVQVKTDRANTEQVKTEQNVAKATLAKPPQYGDPAINLMFDYWKTVTGLDVMSNRQRNRNACANLIKKYGNEKLCRLMDGVALAHQDKFAPRISDFVSLQAKLNELLVWGKRNSQTDTKKVIRV